MKTTAAVSLAALFAIQAARAAAPEALFNGVDLEGWGAYLDKPGVGMADVWSVRDGILICKGEPMGYLHTLRHFTNFHLVVEWRWAPGGNPGNSGVLLRVNGEPRPLPRSLEMQLKSGDAGAIYGFHGMAIRGPAQRFFQRSGSPLTGDMSGVRKNEAAEREPGEWNRAEIDLDGGRLTVRINGRLVNEAEGCEVTGGPIALQSEGGEIHFRKVEITPKP